MPDSFPNASLWLAAYDIADPARLRSVASCCEDYGRRLQQSVFLCDCSVKKIRELREAVTEQMDPAVDHFVLMALCRRCSDFVVQHGVEKQLPGDPEPMIV